MKFTIVLAMVLAVSSAQLYQQFTTPRPFGRFPTPAPSLPPPPRTVSVNRVASTDQNANIIRYDSDINPDGSFTYLIETDNGIVSEVRGTPRDFGGNPPVVPIVQQGSYGYTSPEGRQVSITFTADENGFQAQGDSIPTPHPIPEAILRSLEHNARNPNESK